MNKRLLKKVCDKQVNEMIDRMHYLCDHGRDEDAFALYSEIEDWVNTKESVEIMSLGYLNDIVNNE